MTRFDVIVAGAGTAGVFAALAAAKEGMSVLLLEKNTACGGIGTLGMIVPYYDKNFIELSGAIDEKVIAKQNSSGFLTPLKENCASAELLKSAFEQELLDAGVQIIYQAVVTGVLSESARITGIQWHDQNGNHEAHSSVVIDATAEGSVLALAGAEFLPETFRQPYARIYAYPVSGKIWMNGGDAGYVNQDDPENLTAECLKSGAAQLPELFTEENKRFITAPVLGVREGRHLKARETLHFSELIRGIQSPSPVAWEQANFDTHTIDLALENDEFYAFCIVAMQWETRLNIAIPFGALIPEKLEGIIAAGRMLSADHETSQAVRMKGCMKHLGAVAGTAAAIAVKRGISLFAVSTADITALYPLPEQETLLRENSALWLQNPVQIRENLRSNKPGTAIWSAYLQRVREPLYDLLEEPGFARAHAAFALALQQDKHALPVLRDLAAARGKTLSDTMRNEPIREPHGAIAAYLLGFLNDKESFPLLCNLFQESDEFFFVAAAWKSLLRLIEKNPDLQKSGCELLKKFAEGRKKIPPFHCYCGELCDATEKIRALTVWSFEKLSKQTPAHMKKKCALSRNK